MTDAEWALITSLPLHEMVDRILRDNPKTSALELLTRAQSLGRTNEGKPLTKAHMKRIKDACAQQRAGAVPGGVDDPLAPPTIDEARKRLREATDARDARGANSWARTVKILEGSEQAARPEDVDDANWDLLTEPERAALEYLVCKAHGQEPDDDGLWWSLVFACVPASPEATHIAHVPLPDVPRPATPKVP